MHGGAFFKAIGEEFDDLWRRRDVVSADVLDAWYDPAPKVVEATREHLPWLIKTSPPTHGDGLIRTLSEVRGIPESSIVLGAGTSSLLFSALPLLLEPEARCVILEPTYGEYPHLLESVLGLRVDRVALSEDIDFRADVGSIVEAARGAALVALVNPNSPNGAALSRADMEALIRGLEPNTRLWIDETYVDFVPGVPTVEDIAAHDRRVVVAKSMSKYYALSGLRVGYLVCEPATAAALNRRCPPWPVSLIGQVAAVASLRESSYYRRRAQETAALREAMAAELSGLQGITVYSSSANFLLCRTEHVDSDKLVERTQAAGVFLRDCASLSSSFGKRFFRTAVKDGETNERIVSATRTALDAGP